VVRRKAVWSSLAWLVFSGSSALSEEPAKFLALKGARFLDAEGRRWNDHGTLIVAGDRIHLLGKDVIPPPGAEVLDLGGWYVVPGLIDLHTHLLLHPYNETSWDDQVLKESLELRTIRAVTAARCTLESGFTTLRELGTEGAGFADVALRDSIQQGIIPGPRLLVTTKAIVASGCYGPMGFDPRISFPKGAQEADGEDGMRKAVREQIAAGADWIKVYADYRRRPDQPATASFTVAELRAAVEEAGSVGFKVAAHATTPEGIRRAVEAGVATIEHGTDADEEALALMKERGVVLCPTLAAVEATLRYRGWKTGEPDPPRMKSARAVFRMALEMGVVIACGSDAGVFAHGDNVREIELMVESGMSPSMALQSATTIAAKLLGRDQDLGRIAPGSIADLVVLEMDPLQDPSALRDPLLVIASGRIVHDRRQPAAERR